MKGLYRGLFVVEVFESEELLKDTSSKGNQPKYYKKEEDIFVKEDYLGYEGMAEVVASRLLGCSNIRDLGFSYVEYEQTYTYKERVGYTLGCLSGNFLSEGEEFITLSTLIRKGLGQDVETWLSKQPIREKITNVVAEVEKITGINNFGAWLTFVLEFDNLILNEDRHWNNLGVIRKGGKYKLMPLFDHGLSFFADTSLEYDLYDSFTTNLRKINSKPFSNSFDKQLREAQDLYGEQLQVDYNVGDITDCSGYSKREIERVILTLQRSKKRSNLDWD